jgi:hypothetical protein
MADAEFFLSNESCATCHERQAREFQGSMHTAAHNDPLYRHLAEIARREGGDEVYTFCSSCHASAAVLTGAIPSVSDKDLAPELKAGVTCDTCHLVTALKGSQGGWREEGNASLIIEQGMARFGPLADLAENRLHTSEKRDFFARSEFCASCHTVIHPTSGLRIEHTYGEWKQSIYAQKGIQCQDCHMNSVEDAVKVAETLEPVVRTGQSAVDTPSRRIHPHFFVGGSADADRLANGPEHARMAEARLKSAAKMAIAAPRSSAAGSDLRFEVAVQNVAAGHNLPSGVTELRRIWVDLHVVDGRGATLYRTDKADGHGDFGSDTLWFGALAAGASGQPTYKLWEMQRFLTQRGIPPKGTERKTFTTKLPSQVVGPIAIEARLLYQSAPPSIVAEIMKDDAFVPKVTEMATARVSVEVE